MAKGLPLETPLSTPLITKMPSSSLGTSPPKRLPPAPPLKGLPPPKPPISEALSFSSEGAPPPKPPAPPLKGLPPPKPPISEALSFSSEGTPPPKPPAPPPMFPKMSSAPSIPGMSSRGAKGLAANNSFKSPSPCNTSSNKFKSSAESVSVVSSI